MSKSELQTSIRHRKTRPHHTRKQHLWLESASYKLLASVCHPKHYFSFFTTWSYLLCDRLSNLRSSGFDIKMVWFAEFHLQWSTVSRAGELQSVWCQICGCDFACYCWSEERRQRGEEGGEFDWCGMVLNPHAMVFSPRQSWSPKQPKASHQLWEGEYTGWGLDGRSSRNSPPEHSSADARPGPAMSLLDLPTEVSLLLHYMTSVLLRYCPAICCPWEMIYKRISLATSHVSWRSCYVDRIAGDKVPSLLKKCSSIWTNPPIRNKHPASKGYSLFNEFLYSPDQPILTDCNCHSVQFRQPGVALLIKGSLPLVPQNCTLHKLKPAWLSGQAGINHTCNEARRFAESQTCAMPSFQNVDSFLFAFAHWEDSAGYTALCTFLSAAKVSKIWYMVLTSDDVCSFCLKSLHAWSVH